MSSEYMRQLMETVQPAQRLEEGILDAIEDHFTDKGLEWKSQYSQRAAGELDTRRLAKNVYDTFQYNLGKTDEPQTIESLLKFFKQIAPNVNEQDLHNVLEKAGIESNTKTTESFSFIRSLTEAQEISDRQVKKATRALVSYLIKKNEPIDTWLGNLLDLAPAKEQRDIKQNVSQASQETVQDVKQDQDAQPEEEPKREPDPLPREKREDSEKEREEPPKLADYAKVYKVSPEAIKGLEIVGKMGYIETTEDDVKYNSEKFMKDIVGMKGNKLKGRSLSQDQLQVIQDFLEDFSNNPQKVQRIAKHIVKHHPRAFD